MATQCMHVRDITIYLFIYYQKEGKEQKARACTRYCPEDNNNYQHKYNDGTQHYTIHKKQVQNSYLKSTTETFLSSTTK